MLNNTHNHNLTIPCLISICIALKRLLTIPLPLRKNTPQNSPPHPTVQHRGGGSPSVSRVKELC
jgi:hypothetical protein